MDKDKRKINLSVFIPENLKLKKNQVIEFDINFLIPENLKDNIILNQPKKKIKETLEKSKENNKGDTENEYESVEEYETNIEDDEREVDIENEDDEDGGKNESVGQDESFEEDSDYDKQCENAEQDQITVQTENIESDEEIEEIEENEVFRKDFNVEQGEFIEEDERKDVSDNEIDSEKDSESDMDISEEETPKKRRNLIQSKMKKKLIIHEANYKETIALNSLEDSELKKINKKIQKLIDKSGSCHFLKKGTKHIKEINGYNYYIFKNGQNLKIKIKTNYIIWANSNQQDKSSLWDSNYCVYNICGDDTCLNSTHLILETIEGCYERENCIEKCQSSKTNHGVVCNHLPLCIHKLIFPKIAIRQNTRRKSTLYQNN